MKEKLEASGFEQSKHDACLLFSEKVICLVYVNNTLFFARDSKDIEDVINRLKSVSTLEVTTEDDGAGFLGVHTNRREDGTIELVQTGLIDRIITPLDIGDQKPKNTPAAHGALTSNVGDVDEQGIYNYRSVIGMLVYLSGHSRPDIHFVVTQCAQ